MKLKSVGEYLRYREEIIRERRRTRNHLIIVEPFGGLANRMRVIASGICLKNKTNSNLVVIWSPDQALNCSYEQIFENSGNFKIIRMNDYLKNVEATNQASRGNAIHAFIVNKFMGIDYCIKEHDFDHLIKPGKLDILEVAGKNKVVYFQTCRQFGDGDNAAACQSFKPIAEIREQIDHVARAFTAATIGVHVRRTDSAKSIEHSPLSMFIEKMRHEISVDAKTNFFLATDDRGVEREMINAFGARIIIHNKELSRRTVKGMQDAVIDLYCLSRTRKILGSYWSSYSGMAATIGQTELEIIKK